MRLLPRHIFLATGIITLIISFLFFGRVQKIYSFLLIAGLLLSITSYAFILFKDSGKLKLTWTAIVVLSIVIQQVTEKSFIAQSFKILIQNNRETLNKVNSIFISKPGNVLYLKSKANDSLKVFSGKEVETINRLFSEANIHLILKDSSRIFYETYGMLDVRIGISYRYSKSPTDFGTGLKTYVGKWEY